jgi:hypothetical protein
MPGGRRLRDFFLGRANPPAGESDIEDLMREIGDTDGLDIEEIARSCVKGQARVWERIEEMMRREGRDE